MPPELTVTPIIIPHIAWNTFLQDISNSTGRSPTHGMDESGQRLTIFAKFLTALQEFRENRTVNPIDTLRTANTLLNHLAFSFLVESSDVTIFKALEMTTLNGVSAKTENGRIVLLSGTLGEWKLATIDLCNAKCTDLRWLGKTLLELFFKLGLKSIFADFDSKIRRDGTLLLTHRT